ncbi:Dehydrogenase/reductase SDR family member 11 [Chionoecetes opilio]|uniref:Dehydrogenase/reductase SDR family member 11 n=1 Tax=Chionoecetes opilio TaxID=41210 RepID=A0A8J5CG50_CHIOP|nr:Dehydrogenase/reductase SDR family member 11 [Chionoecetes opilio]
MKTPLRGFWGCPGGAARPWPSLGTGMERWSGRVALVTGASAGIGASVARRLVAEGMRVVGAARSVERVQALADELKGQPGTLIPIKCDITKDDQVMSMFARIKRELGGVDVCVNNAGLAVFKDLLEGSPEEWPPHAGPQRGGAVSGVRGRPWPPCGNAAWTMATSSTQQQHEKLLVVFPADCSAHAPVLPTLVQGGPARWPGPVSSVQPGPICLAKTVAARD